MKPARAITPWMFLAPGLVVFGLAVLLPMVFTVGYSFTTWDGFGEMTFVGLDNYAQAAADPEFRDSFVHVLIYIAATLVLEVLVGLGLAGLVSMGPGRLWQSTEAIGSTLKSIPQSNPWSLMGENPCSASLSAGS